METFNNKKYVNLSSILRKNSHSYTSLETRIKIYIGLIKHVSVSDPTHDQLTLATH